MPTDEAERLAAIDAAMGAFADVEGISTESLLRDRREEKEREERRFQERFSKQQPQ